MTKRDYEIIAGALFESNPKHREFGTPQDASIANHQHAYSVNQMVRALSRANPLFREDKFRKACGS